MVKEHTFLKRQARSTSVSSCRAKWSKASGFIQTALSLRAASTIISLKDRVLGPLLTAIKFMEAIDRFRVWRMSLTSSKSHGRLKRDSTTHILFSTFYIYIS